MGRRLCTAELYSSQLASHHCTQQPPQLSAHLHHSSILHTDRLATTPNTCLFNSSLPFFLLTTPFLKTSEKRCPSLISTNTNTTTMTRTRPCSAVTAANNAAKKRQLKIPIITTPEATREKSPTN